VLIGSLVNLRSCVSCESCAAR